MQYEIAAIRLSKSTDEVRAVLLLWGVAVGVTGVIGLNIGTSHSGRFTVIALGVLIGGMGLVTAGIFLYAARTKKN